MSRTIKRWKFWPGSSTNHAKLYPARITDEDAEWLIGLVRDYYFDRKEKKYKSLPEAEIEALFKRRLAKYYFCTKRARHAIPSEYSRIRNRAWTAKANQKMYNDLKYDPHMDVVLPRQVRDAGWYWW